MVTLLDIKVISWSQRVVLIAAFDIRKAILALKYGVDVILATETAPGIEFCVILPSTHWYQGALWKLFWINERILLI